MLSPISRTPLNSTAATVSSTFLPASSSSSSPFRATSKQKQKRSSGFSSPVISSSQCPSFLSLFLATFFSYLMCQTLVLSVPTVAPSHNVTDRNFNIHNIIHSTRENLMNSSRTHSQDDMPQNDEPPRKMFPSNTVPASWKRQPQKRIYYLRAENDQFLQFHGYTVTGTKVAKPSLGLVRFLSHEQSVVIVGFHEKKYLCMNSSYILYLSDNIDHECYIQESSLLDRGSHATAYDFIKYKKDKKLYLGINCDPMLGTETNLSMKATRFSRLDISEEEAEAARVAIEKSGPEQHVKEKCKTVYENKIAAKKRRQKLRNRWCWNIDRIATDPKLYIKQCKDRENETCSKSYMNSDSEDCVCDILERMMDNPKRAKRRCLFEKLTKWVENQNVTSNSKAILEISRLLLHSYSGIARRMRTLKSKQNTSQGHDVEISNVGKNKHKEQSHEHRTKPKHHTSTQHPNVKKNNSRCRENSSKRTERRCRHQVIKLNSILDKFKNELIMSPDSSSIKDTSPSTFSSKDVSSSFTGEKLEGSVLSEEFRNVLNSLNNVHSKRRNRKQHRKKPRKSRRLKDSKTRSGQKVKAHIHDSRNHGAVSPG